MYRIIAYDNPTDKIGKVIFDLKTNKYISVGKLTLKETDIDDFQLTINQENLLFGNVRPFQTLIDIYDDDELIFKGRALKPKREMKDSGQFTQSFSFESVSAYMLDSVQRFKEVHNTTPANFFKMIIDKHNSQVPAYKQFKVGKVDVTNSTDNVYRFIDYTNTFDTIKTKLIDKLGGYIRIRFESDGNYIDYLNNIGTVHENDNPIRIGKNLKSSSVDIDPTAIITRFVPLGATIERKNNNGNTNPANPRVTIASVNGGKDYIDIPDLQKEFGIINGTETWDDVKTSKILFTKAKSWIKAQKASLETWTISALELGIKKYDSFKVSDSYQFINPIIADSQYLRIVQKQIDLLKPQSSTLTIGDKKKTLSQYQKDAKKNADEIKRIKSSVNDQVNQNNNIIEDIKKHDDEIKKQNEELERIKEELDKLNNGDDNSNGVILDVSEFQGDISFKTLKSMGVSLVIIRISDGQSYEDKYFKRNIAKAKEAGINYAVYAFGRYSNDVEAKQEATALFNRAKAENANPAFYMIDLETQNSANMRVTTQTWNAQMSALGVPANKQVAYIANHLYDQFNIDVSKFGSIVIPSYGANDGTVEHSTKPTHPYDLWQYTSVGRISGITGNVDMNTEPSSRFKKQYLGG